MASLIIVRPATTADIPTLLRFEQSVIAAERPFDPTLKENPVYYDLPALIASPDTQLLVAELDGAIIGSGYARIEKANPMYKHSHHAYIGFMYVDPGHRGKGINQLIIDGLRQWAHGRGITELRLEVYYDNEAAIRAYEKAGFTRLWIQMRTPV
ncbi:MAG TPA: GNAT family N-acetyltransferase [Puia sp.]|nr:GNAT family N-acetyltransferase [Puia sp.]